MEKIAYTLERKRVKNINLRVRMDGSVVVSASPRVSQERVDEFVQSKADFIRKARESMGKVRENAPEPLCYITGEQVCLLGKWYTLQVIEGGRQQVAEQGDVLTITVKQGADRAVKDKLFRQFLAQQCLLESEKIAQQVFAKMAYLGIKMPTLRVRSMTSRWGSCLPTKGAITINTKLMERPLGCLYYVMLHEFCHLVHPNHSKDFYNLVAQFMPDWKAWKQLL
ncbi:SprT family zinc-dependent metalloprotease [Bengtsoniella intestinalis]|uniref:M48 family metallopeptidase n=1 Tax=Bengtsoniella intestinalis TaxID=3073143 RepID=UPI00391FA3BD